MNNKSSIDSIYTQSIVFLLGAFFCLIALYGCAVSGVSSLFAYSPRSGRLTISSGAALLVGGVLVFFSGKNILRILKRKNQKR
jgi:hypothetical protein